MTLIRGEQSPPVIADIHAALCKALPQVTDRVVQEAGHMVPMTHTEKVAALIA